MFIPGHEHYTEMTPSEFEEYSLQLLGQLSKNLEDVKIDHDVIVKTHDGIYQIDGRISYTAFGVNYVTLVECKRYKGPIKREHIQILNDKMDSIGANKGIFITTSYYQLGAYDYAKAHGIALLVIANGQIKFEVRSKDAMIQRTTMIDIPKFVSIWQEKKQENIIHCITIDGDDSFYEFYNEL